MKITSSAPSVVVSAKGGATEPWLFTVDGKAKYPLWDLVDAGNFKGLTRGGKPITKTHKGDMSILLKKLKGPTHRKHQ